MADWRKTVLITGCTAPGIGYHLAQAFHRHGYRVFATARKAESIALLDEQGIEALSLVVDDEKSVEECFGRVEKLLDGRGLEFLINNADYTMPALDVQMSEVRTTFASNLYGVMLVNKTFIPLVLAARGALVHIGSVAGYMPYLFGSAYNASKAALHAYCNTLRIELAPFGVHVLTLITGGVKSNIARTERQLPEGSLYAPFDKQFRRRVTHSQEVTMKTSVYAEQAVKECENARGCLWSRNEVWMGSRVWQVWWGVHIDGFWPGGLWGLVMSKMFDIKSQIKSK